MKLARLAGAAVFCALCMHTSAQPATLMPELPETLSENVTQYTFAHTDFIRLGPDGGTASYDVFIIGENSQSFTASRSITPFYMNRFEISYRLWFDVRVRAEAIGYVFHNPGQEGSAGRRGREPTENRYMPVTAISWYDAIVWCNALSELAGKTPCYTYNGKVLRDSGNAVECDLAVCGWDTGGYRLPTEAEWEYAARKTSRGFQRGDLASGCVTDDGLSSYTMEAGEVSWNDANSAGTHIIGTAGNRAKDSAESGNTHDIPATGKPNAMGLFDMSGNVLEYCWDWFADYTQDPPGARSAGPRRGSERVSRGGSWSPYTKFVFAGDRYSFDPNEAYNYMGFRIVTSGE